MPVKTKKSPVVTVIPTRIYKWRGGSFNGVQAQIVGEELERLEIKPGDYHKTKDILDDARHPDSPLHQCFEWDDEKAAEQQRLNTCRSMLRTISVVIVQADKRVKQPVYLHVSDQDGPRYVRTDRVVSDDELKRRAVDEALIGLNSWRKRFEYIQELQPIFEAIGKVTKSRKK